MVYLHPILGILSVALMCWLALVGLRSRHRARYAGSARATHRRYTPWALALWWLTLVAGWGSTLWLRDDLTPASTWHFRVAWVAIVSFTAAGALTLLPPRARWTRRVHPILGLAAVACALTLAVLGMNLLP